jgi:uncharacterized protein YlzI (FlbEa/FlbD family)
MIRLQTWNSNSPIAVNPHQVTYVKEAPAGNGCVIYFADEKCIHVKNDYLEVIASIGNHL